MKLSSGEEEDCDAKRKESEVQIMGKIINILPMANREGNLQEIMEALQEVKDALVEVLDQYEEEGAEEKADTLTEALDALEDAYDVINDVVMDEI